jgi:hypothetical protein
LPAYVQDGLLIATPTGMRIWFTAFMNDGENPNMVYVLWGGTWIRLANFRAAKGRHALRLQRNADRGHPRWQLDGRAAGVAVLMEVPIDEVEGGTVVMVEADRSDIPESLILASSSSGKAVAVAARSLSASLERLEPVLQTLKDKLAESAPEHFTVEFGVNLGGETGIILAKGTAEVNLKITMTWDQKA